VALSFKQVPKNDRRLTKGTRMPLFGKKEKGKTTKLFFVTDVHGSETTFRKFVNSGKFYGVDVARTGRRHRRQDRRAHSRPGWRSLPGDHPVADQDSIATRRSPSSKSAPASLASTTAIVSPDEYDALKGDPEKVDELYHRLAAERLAAWVRLAEERLAGTGIRCYITGGNDDSVDVLEVLDPRSRRGRR